MVLSLMYLIWSSKRNVISSQVSKYFQEEIDKNQDKDSNHPDYHTANNISFVHLVSLLNFKFYHNILNV